MLFVNIVMALNLLVGSVAARRACEVGNKTYCSSGLLRGYIGPLDSAAQLREALEATAHKRELIVFGDGRVAESAQTLARFRNNGYSHVLYVSGEMANCERLEYIFLPWRKKDGPISCGTYATHDESGQPYPTGFKFFTRKFGDTHWWYKWYTTARAIALGYNVMAVDSDVLIMDDFYVRVKEPSPLARYQMISQAESRIKINGGFSYVQNAAPNGPVAWMFYEMIHKLVRWTDDPSEFYAMAPEAAKRQFIQVDDQDAISDALYSCINGRTSHGMLAPNVGNDQAAWAKFGVQSAAEYIDRLANLTRFWKMEVFPVPSSNELLGGLVCEQLPDIELCRREPPTNFTAQTVELKMPHSGGVHPLEYGGYPFTKEPGPLTRAFRQSFKDLGVPLPPDPEDPATEAAARATPPEHLVLMHSCVPTCPGPHPNPMGWVEATWSSAGRKGLWHTHLAPPGGHLFQSVGHVYAGMLPGAPAAKDLALQSAGHFDWRVASRAAGHPHKAYLTGLEGPEPEIRRVVAYAPGLVPDNITKEEYVAALNGLAQLGVVLGAVVAWPELDCNTEWVQARPFRNKTRTGPHAIPWTYLNTEHVVYPFGDSLETLKCQWNAVHKTECLANRRPNGLDVGRALTPIEFHHLLARMRHQLYGQSQSRPQTQTQAGHRQDAVAAQAVGTPLKLAKDGGAPPASPAHPGMAAPAYGELLESNLDVMLYGHVAGSVPVLWVGRLVAGVGGLREDLARVYDNWRKTCHALHYFELNPRPDLF